MTEFLPPVQVRTTRNGISLQRGGYGGIEVFLLTEVPHNGRLYYGFEFSFVCDFRDISNNFVKAALISPNQVAFQLPATNAQFNLDYEDVWNKTINHPKQPAKASDPPIYHELYCPRTSQAHTISYNKHLDSPHLKVRIVVLTFPKSMVLSNEKYSSKTKNGIIEHVPCPMVSIVKGKSTKDVVLNNIRSVWRVLVEDDDAPKIDQTSAIEENQAVLRMEAMMKQMGI